MEALQLLATQRRLEGKIKLGQSLDRRQSAGAHGGLQPPIVAQLDLRAQQLLDRFGCAQCRAIDTVENRIERFERARHA